MIEKAHPDVFNILLQILDDGILTDAQGRRVDFKNCIIIMTSNVGASSILEPKRLGFADSDSAEGDADANMRQSVMDALKATFRPEFLNRIDDIIVFNKLSDENIKAIASLMLGEVKSRIAERGINMLLAKHDGKTYRTEVIMPNHEEIPIPSLSKPLSQCKIGLVTDGGLVPAGNPDNQVPTNSKAYKRYSIDGMETLDAKDWEVSHQGYNNAFVLQDPNRLVPVDALRKMVKEGVIGSLDDVFYSTAGVMTPMEKCKEFGEGIAKALKEAMCDAAIETST